MKAPLGKVLVVDDEPLVLEIFSIALADDGFEIEQADGALSAIKCLEHKKFDVLVCDVRLEPYDGFEIVEIAKKHQPDLGVVLTTGRPIDSDSERAKIQGVTYLLKPVELNILRGEVRRHLQKSQIKKSQNNHFESFSGELNRAHAGK